MRSTTPRYAGWVLLASLLSAAAQAAPYRPQNDAQVLERLQASRPVPPSAAPRPDLAARLARVYIERARASGDPRELGYARGVLAPWWAADDAPDPVLLLRATLRQSAHDFSGALEDLDRLLARRPDDAQAWLTRATVLRVLGRYPEARAACAQLVGRADSFVATLCAESLRGLNGELAAAGAAIDALRPRLATQPRSIAAWYHAERAEIAVRAGDVALAERRYREALAAHPDDLDLRAAFADLLLDQDRAAEVLTWIDGDTAADALRLRRALALQALRDPAFAALDRGIREGFAAARRRGESLHLREEARYRLAAGDTAQALELARANWLLQREPWDARLLLQAAAAANDARSAESVPVWLSETGLEDARLRAAP